MVLVMISILVSAAPCDLAVHTSNPQLSWFFADWCKVQAWHTAERSLEPMNVSDAVDALSGLQCDKLNSGFPWVGFKPLGDIQTFAQRVCGDVYPIPTECQVPDKETEPHVVVESRYLLANPVLCPCGFGARSCAFLPGVCPHAQGSFHYIDIAKQVQIAANIVAEYDHRVALHRMRNLSFMEAIDACLQRYAGRAMDGSVRRSFVDTFNGYNTEVQRRGIKLAAERRIKCSLLENLDFVNDVPVWRDTYCK
tara:strand:+ start:2922 stop:3677 length:756 start_codon:yes stop_codon:yes gene_type:complete